MRALGNRYVAGIGCSNSRGLPVVRGHARRVCCVRSVNIDHQQPYSLFRLIQQGSTGCVLSADVPVELLEQLVDFSHPGRVHGNRLDIHSSPVDETRRRHTSDSTHPARCCSGSVRPRTAGTLGAVQYPCNNAHYGTARCRNRMKIAQCRYLIMALRRLAAWPVLWAPCACQRWSARLMCEGGITATQRVRDQSAESQAEGVKLL